MNQITEDDVRKVAKLARLGLIDEEVEQATADLQGILDHFSKIQDINTDGVPTYDDASGLHNITVKDKAQPEELAQRKDLLEITPDTKDNQIKVTAVFEQKNA